MGRRREMTGSMLTRRVFSSAWLSAAVRAADEPRFQIDVRQVTHGPSHHFFGYIGHAGNVPWNGNGSYIVALRTSFQNRMPRAGDAADVVLLDTRRGYTVTAIDQSRGWNFQQGTMFYWHPPRPDRELIFNDRDPRTNHVFTVLYDVERRKRIREFRYPETPFGNSGVAQRGGRFLGLNYARMARLRPVTGYPETYDWNPGEMAPANDGIFLADLRTGKQRMLISFREMVERLRGQHPSIGNRPLFINHTLWSRDDSWIYFYVRGNFEIAGDRTNVPCLIRPDGSGFTPLSAFIGGHPEWESGSRLIGSAEGRQVIYDTASQRITGSIGTPEILPDPGADVALSPDGGMLVNGYRKGHSNFYVVYRRADQAWGRTRGFPHPGLTSGELRVDGSPCWNRKGDQFLFPAIAADGTRQIFIATISGL